MLSKFLEISDQAKSFFNSKDVNGEEFTVRRCHPHGKEKAGTCEDATHLDMNVEFCFCDTNECNGSNQLHPSFHYASFIISTMLMLLAKNQL